MFKEDTEYAMYIHTLKSLKYGNTYLEIWKMTAFNKYNKVHSQDKLVRLLVIHFPQLCKNSIRILLDTVHSSTFYHTDYPVSNMISFGICEHNKTMRQRILFEY